MKSVVIGVRSAVLSSAFKLDGISHSSGVTPDLLSDASVVAANLPLYASLRPDDAFRTSFLLLGTFPQNSSQHQDVSAFLDQQAATPALKPLAQAAIVSLYAGPKRPDEPSHRAADFLVKYLPRLKALDKGIADIAADALLMHSDAKPFRKDAAAGVKSHTIDAEFQSDPGLASETASWAIVSAGPKLTPTTRHILAFQAANLPLISAVDAGAERRIPLLGLYYATEGSKGKHWSEDQLSTTLEQARRDKTLDGRNEAFQIAWALTEAGNPAREPARIAERFLSSAFGKDPLVADLLHASPGDRAARAKQTRKEQRALVRDHQAGSVTSPGVRSDLHDLLARGLSNGGPQNRLN